MIDLLEYEEKLRNLRQDLLTRRDAIHQDTHHINEPVEKDFAEQATQSENDDVLNALESETEHTIHYIDSALKSISDGNYGYCQKCGEAINEKRLKAIPYATLCINCAE